METEWHVRLAICEDKDNQDNGEGRNDTIVLVKRMDKKSLKQTQT